MEGHNPYKLQQFSMHYWILQFWLYPITNYCIAVLNFIKIFTYTHSTHRAEIFFKQIALKLNTTDQSIRLILFMFGSLLKIV